MKQKKKWEDEQAKKLAEKNRREKEEDRKYKEKVKENIRLDKERREAELKKLQSANQQLQPSSAPVVEAPPVVVPVKKEFTECVVQLRMADGRSFQGTFKPTDPLRSVLTLLSSNGIIGNYALMSTFPKKVYHGSALDSTTLQQADLVPRGSLMVTTNF